MPHSKEIEKEFLARIGEHQGILHKICFVYAKNDLDKEDLYQEIILQLWKSYPSFQEKSRFSTWMYRVALNTAITQVKKPVMIFAEAEKALDLPVAAETWTYSEEVLLLHKAISYLNKIEKAIVLLWLEEKSYDEIADTVGLTVKNVSVKLVRIKKKLTELIKRLQKDG